MRHYIAVRNKKEEDDEDEDIVVHHHTHHHHHPHSDVGGASTAYGSEVAYSHPSTWHGRSDSHEGRMSIVKMEYDELLAAHAMRDKHAVRKELKDLHAACALALSEMDS